MAKIDTPLTSRRKRFAPLVLFAPHRHGAQADAALPDVDGLPVRHQLGAHGVQRLIAVSVWPPQLRIFDDDVLVHGHVADPSGAVTVNCTLYAGSLALAQAGMALDLGFKAQADGPSE